MRDFFEDEERDYEEDIEEEMENMFENMGFPAEAVVEITNLGLFRQEARYRLLQTVIAMLENSFFWRFRSPEWKRNAIKRAFTDFEGLLGIDEE